jgi:flagellar motor component MotA
MQWMYIAGGLGCLVAGMALGGRVAAFLDLASALIVVVTGFAFTFWIHGVSDVLGALKAGFSAPGGELGDTNEKGLILQTLRSSLCACGGAGFLIGLVNMLQNMSDPSAIGPAMAVACLTILYAVVLAELVIAPMASRLRMAADQPAVLKSSADSDGASAPDA